MRLRRPARGLSIALAQLFTTLTSVAVAATFTVTNSNDSGAGSLRQAILDANGNAGADTIAFNITGSGVHTIAPASALPTITEAVTINGYSQPGASANTNAPNQGTNAVILIEIDGTSIGSDNGLGASAAVTIRGLAINRCPERGHPHRRWWRRVGNRRKLPRHRPDRFLAARRAELRRGDRRLHGRRRGRRESGRPQRPVGQRRSYRSSHSDGPNTVVKGNLIGTDATGTIAVPGMSDYAQI